ncbi:MAG: [protein-PII] uridylyltransferase, partial [Melioribacteraceae bacterium]|nr:[protein-PII] uridylyltransferase [Melioribacteraceae bacterium]
MEKPNNYKEEFLAERSELFKSEDLYENAYEFCIKHSLLVEEYIIRLIQPLEIGCVLAAVGGFSRRELSPYSDIDVMFICSSSKGHEQEIQKCIAALWDSGIEASHTVREFADIEKFIDEDLRTFTQFFETRFLIGNIKIYESWNAKLFSTVQESNREKLIYNYFDDVEARYAKYGRSPKVLEPNLKFTGGGLRDIHSVEWMYLIKNQKLLSVQDEITQTQIFIRELLESGQINRKAYKRLIDSYSTVLRTRNLLHLIEGRKNDRLEFDQQEKIAKLIGYTDANWKDFMHEHFNASTILHRFSKTMMKKYKQEFSSLLSDYLKIDLDDDFEIIGEIIKFKGDRVLSMSEIMRAFYYRCLNDAIFEQNLRSLIIESIHLIEE